MLRGAMSSQCPQMGSPRRPRRITTLPVNGRDEGACLRSPATAMGAVELGSVPLNIDVL